MVEPGEFDALYDKLYPLMASEIGDFTHLKDAVPLIWSNKGVKLAGESEWLPMSQMRVDGAGRLYLANWLYKKRYEEVPR